MGENLIGTETRLTQVTSFGSLFKSQNGGLWTEDQTQDIKFQLNRCSFNLNQEADVILQNKAIRTKVAPLNPIKVSNEGQDLTSRVFGDNPQIIEIRQPNHYLQPNDLVSIEGVTDEIGGIPAANINGVHTVVNSDFNHFTINVGASATSTTIGGGDNVATTYNLAYEVSTLTSGVMNFSGTNFRFKQQPILSAGNSWNAARRREFTDPVNDLAGQNFGNDYIDPGVAGVDRIIQDKYVDEAYRPFKKRRVDVDEDYYWPRPMQIPSYLNKASKFEEMSNQPGVRLDLSMSTTNNFVSPVIDLSRTAMTTTKNVIDNPKRDEERFGINFKTLTFNSDISAAGIEVGDLISFESNADPGETYTVTVKSVENESGQIDVLGRNIYYIDSPDLVTITWDNATLQSIGLESVGIARGNTFRGLEDTDSSAAAQWISRLFEFEDACDGVKLKLTTFQYYRYQVRVLYRARPIGFTGNFQELNWQGVAGRQGLPNNWKKLEYANREKANDPDEIDAGDWTSIEWSFQDRSKFDAIQFKIVMLAVNPAQVPLIQDLQVIASE
jgi:hypothetical protein